MHSRIGGVVSTIGAALHLDRVGPELACHRQQALLSQLIPIAKEDGALELSRLVGAMPRLLHAKATKFICTMRGCAFRWANSAARPTSRKPNCSNSFTAC